MCYQPKKHVSRGMLRVMCSWPRELTWSLPAAAGGALERMEGNISSILQHNTACISALHVLKVLPRSLSWRLPPVSGPASSGLVHVLHHNWTIRLCDVNHSEPNAMSIYTAHIRSAWSATSTTPTYHDTTPCAVAQVYAQRLGCDLNRPAAVSRTLGDAFLLVSEALADPGMLQFSPSVTAAAVLVAARKAQVSLSPCPGADVRPLNTFFVSLPEPKLLPQLKLACGRAGAPGCPRCRAAAALGHAPFLGTLCRAGLCSHAGID